MSEPSSDAERIRNRRLAKLGGATSSSTSRDGDNAAESSSPAAPTSHTATINSTEAQTPNPFSQLGLQSGSTPQQQHTPQQEHIPQQASKRIRITSAGRQEENLAEWEDRTLKSIFRVTLNRDELKLGPGNAHDGQQLHYIHDLAEDVGSTDGDSPKLRLDLLDSVILDAANAKNAYQGKSLAYLLRCWKRVSKLYRHQRSTHKEDPKFAILQDARRICMNYCIYAVTMPEMFDLPDWSQNPLAEHLFADPDKDEGICRDFLDYAVERMPEEESIKEILVGAMEEVSTRLAKMSMNDDYKPAMRALQSFIVYPPLAEALTNSSKFLAAKENPQSLEFETLLGPFFRISPMQPKVALAYFRDAATQPEAYIRNSQNALRMTLKTHQDELFSIVNQMIARSGKGARENMLNWFALIMNANHKRRGMYVKRDTVSSDGFMVNVTVILDRLCEPFMDATYSKVDRIDVEHLRRLPRVNIREETKINADQKASDEFYSQKVEGQSNFITELFFITAAAHHLGLEAADEKLIQTEREVKNLKKHLEELELERHRYAQNPILLNQFEKALQKYKDQVASSEAVIHATRGVLLDEVTQARSMLFMRYTIVWLIRLVSANYPKQPPHLPLPDVQPHVFKCLPEYFLENVIDNFKFVTRHMPHIIAPTQCEELMHFCVTFLRSSEYIKNPGLKNNIVDILFHGTWRIPNRPKGVLGDLLNGSKFAMEHLMHTIVKIFIEVESTGTHTQFYDKFGVRFRLFHILRSIWGNQVYRQNLETESRVNPQFFIRFVNLLMNDVTFVLDESFSAFKNIRQLSEELRAPEERLTTEERAAKEQLLSDHKGRAKSYMDMANEAIGMLVLFTDALADAFTTPEIVTRLADMLDYNLDSLVHPKQQSKLKVDNPKEEYNFVPQNLVADLIRIYVNLGNKETFIKAVARDARSYHSENWDLANRIMKKYGLISPEEMQKWLDLGTSINVQWEKDREEEEDFGEIPDDFADPLLATLMNDPVTLPISKQIVDRSTIQSHLLSDPTDPFNRTPLKIEDVIPNTELKQRIEAWKEQKKAEARAKKEDTMDTS